MTSLTSKYHKKNPSERKENEGSSSSDDKISGIDELCHDQAIDEYCSLEIHQTNINNSVLKPVDCSVSNAAQTTTNKSLLSPQNTCLNRKITTNTINSFNSRSKSSLHEIFHHFGILYATTFCFIHQIGKKMARVMDSHGVLDSDKHGKGNPKRAPRKNLSENWNSCKEPKWKENYVDINPVQRNRPLNIRRTNCYSNNWNESCYLLNEYPDQVQNSRYLSTEIKLPSGQ